MNKTTAMDEYLVYFSIRSSYGSLYSLFTNRKHHLQYLGKNSANYFY